MSGDIFGCHEEGEENCCWHLSGPMLNTLQHTGQLPTKNPPECQPSGGRNAAVSETLDALLKVITKFASSRWITVSFST